MQGGYNLIDTWVFLAAITSALASLILIICSKFITKKSVIYYLIFALYVVAVIFWLIPEQKAWSTWLAITITAGLAFNALRKNFARSDEITSADITYNTLILLVALSLVVVVEYQIIYITWRIMFDFLIGISLVFAIATIINTITTLFKSRIKTVPRLAEAETPTVSLLIAARNEDHALMECLDAAVSSNYPKLEIIVLDDCSYDGTGNIIREFANHGVRFVPGKEPTQQWMGRNFAFSQLADQATGDYLVFMDVDVKLSPDTVSRMIKFSEVYGYEMLSLKPQQQHLDVLPALLQPFGLLWQITFRQILKRPPVDASLWAIKRQTLFELGGFEMNPNVVYPELKFASNLYGIDTYFFGLANADDNVSIRKKVSSLWEKSERSNYPNMKMSPAYVVLSVIFIVSVIALPLLGAWDLWHNQNYLIGNVAGVISLSLWLISHLILTTRVNPSGWFISLFNLPIVVFVEIFLIISSMFKYELNLIRWKGRPVCFK
jgi:glycosyltransferase involved in cell wall biosynthesis